MNKKPSPTRTFKPGGLAARTEAHAKAVGTAPVSVGRLLELEEENTLPTLLLIMSIPGLLPSTGIPLGSVFSLGMFAVGLAWLLGRTEVQLPKKLGNYTLSAKHTKALLHLLARAYGHAERLCRPRSEWIATGTMLRLAGAAVMLNAFIIFLPIPFGNTVPALANIVLALGVMFKDGLTTTAGWAVTMAGSAIAMAFGIAALWALRAVIS